MNVQDHEIIGIEDLPKNYVVCIKGKKVRLERHFSSTQSETAVGPRFLRLLGTLPSWMHTKG